MTDVAELMAEIVGDRPNTLVIEFNNQWLYAGVHDIDTSEAMGWVDGIEQARAARLGQVWTVHYYIMPDDQITISASTLDAALNALRIVLRDERVPPANIFRVSDCRTK